MKERKQTVIVRRLMLGIVVAVASLSAGRLRASDCTTPGCLDATFGSGGVVMTDLKPGGVEFPQGLTAQADGKVVAAVFSGSGIQVVRFATNGILDSTFGSGGIATLHITAFPADQEFATSVAIAPDLDGDLTDFDIVYGAYVPVARKGNQWITGWAIGRLNSDGSTETSFGDGGKTIFGFTSGKDAFCDSVTVDNVGRIVAGGSSNGTAAVARLTANGQFDSSFDSDGKLVTSETGYVVDLHADSSGIVLSLPFALMKRQLSGAPDLSFGASGRVTTGVQASYAGLVVDTTGRILVSGQIQSGVIMTSKPPRSQPVYDAAVVAFQSNGHVDTTFGVNGIAAFNVGDNDTATGLAIDSAGRFVVSAWNYSNGNAGDYIAARFLANGHLDSTFGGSGVVVTTVNVSARADAGVVVTANGIVIGGQSYTPPDNSATMKTTLVRYVQ